ncbi:unnamed protein product [Somion occarium]|uniref:Uncharacterized protein n=1 Tax=Somion occarium TaxID=3059160 RepID=A0ABP1E867_9APHY
MYLALEVHTEDTLNAGEHALLEFGDSLQAYIHTCPSETQKNWNFPKAHTNKHAFADIRAKGATKNFNTKINEKLHGPLKDSYLLRTNKKNFAEQIRPSKIFESN